jgi:hypothetical protein
MIARDMREKREERRGVTGRKERKDERKSWVDVALVQVIKS